jgi:hypothetical protein
LDHFEHRRAASEELPLSCKEGLGEKLANEALLHQFLFEELGRDRRMG